MREVKVGQTYVAHGMPIKNSRFTIQKVDPKSGYAEVYHPYTDVSTKIRISRLTITKYYRLLAGK